MMREILAEPEAPSGGWDEPPDANQGAIGFLAPAGSVDPASLDGNASHATGPRQRTHDGDGHTELGHEMGETVVDPQVLVPTTDDLLDEVTCEVREQYWKTFGSENETRIQAKIFAVEWTKMGPVDPRKIVRSLLDRFGPTVSFVFGIQGEKLDADAMLAIRTGDRFINRDPHRLWTFGEPGEVMAETVRLRLLTPRHAEGQTKGAKGRSQFVREMMKRCDTYRQVYRFHEKILSMAENPSNQSKN